MEAIFLVCGAGGPQLKRNPLGCTTTTMPRRNAAEIEAEYQRFKRFALAFADLLDARALADATPSWIGELGADGKIVYSQFRGPPSQLAPSLRESIAHLEHTRPRGWRSGLRQAIQDLLEMSRDFKHHEVLAADAALAEKGFPTLSILRSEIWGTIPKLLSRGRIRTESEYYLLVDRLNDMADEQLTPQDRERLAGMITEFEERRTKHP